MRPAVVTPIRTARRPLPDHLRYPHGHLFGRWWPTAPPRPARKKTDPKPAPKPKPVTFKRGGDGHTHAVDTARGILIGRLDAMLGDLEAIVEELAAELIPDAGARRSLAIRLIQGVQVRFFPEEFADESDYTTDPAGRLSVPAGLIPKVFTQATAYAEHLTLGMSSPAAKLTQPDGSPLFTQGDIARLGARVARRGAIAGGEARSRSA